MMCVWGGMHVGVRGKISGGHFSNSTLCGIELDHEVYVINTLTC